MEAGQEKTIALSENEQNVFKILLGCVDHFKLDLTVRAAGGWVRDKLLGLESDDIDIVVDKLAGEDFAHKVGQYMAETAQPGCSRIGVVKQNPDQSKHLATACFSINGISLDVNHLRTETYCSESRIPSQISIGTASEDAHRRDFTINALFYNLRDGVVEDFIGTGREDLRSGLIRTPLLARETFKDDPLRILRAVRFAARLGYRVDEAILEAARDSEIAQLLFIKVSRERIGLEIDKMFTAGGLRPVKAVDLLQTMGLLNRIFSPKDMLTGAGDKLPEELTVGIARAGLVVELLGPAVATRPELRLAVFAALLSPLHRHHYKEKSKQRSLIHGLLRVGLRLPNDVSELVPSLVNSAYGLKSLTSAADVERRRGTGEQLRLVRENWRIALALSVALRAHPPTGAGDAAEADALAPSEIFEQQKQWIEDAGLVGCWEWRPFLDGKRLMDPPFNVPKGKRVGSLIEMQIRWRLEDPSVDEAVCQRRLLEEAAA